MSTQLTIEILDAKDQKKPAVLIEDLSTSETIYVVKKKLATKKRVPIEQISLRLEPRGKNLRDEETIAGLKLTNGSAQLFYRNLGPQIAWKTVFLLEYAGPLFVYPLFYLRPSFVYGSAANRPIHQAVTLALICHSFHYAKRLYETQFVHRFSNGTMPVRNLFKNCSYYWGFAAFISYFINHPLFTPPTLGALQLYGGVLAFVVCELGNLSIHLLLRDLRPAGSKERKIPYPNSNPLTQLFNFVSCPNYTYEVGSWIAFSVFTQSLPALLFTTAGFIQMKIWAAGKHRNYKKEFPDYPKDRKPIVPFVYDMVVKKNTEFQAVVLAGGLGSRMRSVTEHIPKAILPLANIPLFWFPLNVLAKNNINDVLLITNEESLERINEMLKDGTVPELPESMKIEVVAPANQDDDWGTADVLRHFMSRITTDFILMSGDFVSDICLRNMIEMHHANSSILTCLLSDTACKSIAPGPKEHIPNKDFIGFCQDSGQLIYLQPEEDLETSEVELDPNWFTNLKRVELSSNYTDCHVYLVDYRLLNVLSWERDHSSIKADLIPFLLDKQNNKDDIELLRLFERTQLQRLAFELQHGVYEEPPEMFRLFSYKTTRDAVSLIAKCNTLGSYLEANKALLEQYPSFLPERVAYPGKKVNVIKSVVDKTSKLGNENVNVVKSAVDANCEIANNTKVEESIIMADVKIASGTKLKRCIVCRGAQIGENCQLENTIVAAGHVVEPKTQLKHELARHEVEMKIEDY
ncbi:Very-long-chain enoyl-CoA reductase [Aphelenchoides besseyi]|nr:Very-long-chain enoyl-CoA reductase [Aphelenchoides besseyi]KAI6194450.1 Very-long-chain enoyl-CoA reductase [Aphelenchoides besseyi]